MKVSSITKIIEKFAPLYLAADFDTPGLNVGDKNQEVNSVLLCENVTMDTLCEAIENNCEMIISHHPAIFGEIKDDFTRDIVNKAHKNKICLYSAHTNLDSCKGGINDRLANLLNINVTYPIENGDCYRIGTFNNVATLFEKEKEISAILKDNNIRTLGDKNRVLKKVCVSCGAGARDDDLVELLKTNEVDVLIGGENKLSIALKMQYYNICLIEVGHYNSEIIAIDIFYDLLKDQKIKIIKSKKDINPYNN